MASASGITGKSSVCSVCLDWQQSNIKGQCYCPFVRGIHHRWPMDSPHKGTVTRNVPIWWRHTGNGLPSQQNAYIQVLLGKSAEPSRAWNERHRASTTRIRIMARPWQPSPGGQWHSPPDEKHPFFKRNRWFWGPIKHPFLKQNVILSSLYKINFPFCESEIHCIKHFSAYIVFFIILARLSKSLATLTVGIIENKSTLLAISRLWRYCGPSNYRFNFLLYWYAPWVFFWGRLCAFVFPIYVRKYRK